MPKDLSPLPSLLSQNPNLPFSPDASPPPGINVHHEVHDAAVVVAVRVRPFLPKEISENEGCCITLDPGTNGFRITNPDYSSDMKRFNYDYAYDSSNSNSSQYTNQNKIFNDLGTKIIDNAFEGYNCSMFAYGQTGSGKTFTMSGTASEEGIIPRTCKSLFDRMEDQKVRGPPRGVDRVEYKIEVSYLEIYNERVKDLLDPSTSDLPGGLRVREHPSLGPYVEGLSKVLCMDRRSVELLMDEGSKLRTVAATNMNETSSRSHSIFTLILTQLKETGMPGTEDHNASETVSKINLVDLAGSERQEKTHSTGIRLVEASNINKSLHALGKTIHALASQSVSGTGAASYIPYRDSSLTWLLKESLGGNAKTIMIATVSPANSNYEESLSTLRYADQAKHIINKAKINEDPVTKLIRELNEEVARLKNELESREKGSGKTVTDPGMLSEMERLREQVSANERLMREMNMSWDERLSRTKDIAARRQRYIGQSGICLFEGHPTCPCLINLNEDPMISELLVFLLEKAVTRIGRGSLAGRDKDAKDQIVDIQLSGKFIEIEHCLVMNSCGIDKDRPKIMSTTIPVVSIRASPNAKVFHNGRLLSPMTTVTLTEGDRIVLGQNHVFRFSHPQQVLNNLYPSMADVVDYSYAQKELSTLNPILFPSPDSMSRDKQALEQKIAELEAQIKKNNEDNNRKIVQSQAEFERQLDSMEEEFVKEQIAAEQKMKVLQSQISLGEEKYQRDVFLIRQEAEKRNCELLEKDRLLQQSANTLELQTVQFEQKLKTMKQNYEENKKITEDKMTELEKTMVVQRQQEQTLREEVSVIMRQKEAEATSKDKELRDAMAKLEQQRAEYETKVSKLENDYMEEKQKEEQLLAQNEEKLKALQMNLKVAQDKARAEFDATQTELNTTAKSLSEMEILKEKQRQNFEDNMKQLALNYEVEQEKAKKQMEESNMNLTHLILELDEKKRIEQNRVQEKEIELIQRSAELDDARQALKNQEQENLKQIKDMESRMELERRRTEREKEVLKAELLKRQEEQEHQRLAVTQELQTRERELSMRKSELWEVTRQLESERDAYNSLIVDLETRHGREQERTRAALEDMNAKVNRAQVLVLEKVVKTWQNRVRERPIRLANLMRCLCQRWKSAVHHPFIQDRVGPLMGLIHEANSLAEEQHKRVFFTPKITITYEERLGHFPDSELLPRGHRKEDLVVFMCVLTSRQEHYLTCAEFMKRVNDMRDIADGITPLSPSHDPFIFSHTTEYLSKGHLYLRPLLYGATLEIEVPTFSVLGLPLCFVTCVLALVTPLSSVTLPSSIPSPQPVIDIGDHLSFSILIKNVKGLPRRRGIYVQGKFLIPTPSIITTIPDMKRTHVPTFNHATVVVVEVTTDDVWQYLMNEAMTLEVWVDHEYHLSHRRSPAPPSMLQSSTHRRSMQLGGSGNIPNNQLLASDICIAIDLLEKVKHVYVPVVVATDGSKGRFFKLRAGKSRRLLIALHTNDKDEAMIHIDDIVSAKITEIRTDVDGETESEPVTLVSKDICYGHADNDLLRSFDFDADDLKLDLLTQKSRDYVYFNVVIELRVGHRDEPMSIERVVRTKVYAASSKFSEEYENCPVGVEALYLSSPYQSRLITLFDDHTMLIGPVSASTGMKDRRKSRAGISGGSFATTTPTSSLTVTRTWSGPAPRLSGTSLTVQLPGLQQSLATFVTGRASHGDEFNIRSEDSVSEGDVTEVTEAESEIETLRNKAAFDDLFVEHAFQIILLKNSLNHDRLCQWQRLNHVFSYNASPTPSLPMDEQSTSMMDVTDQRTDDGSSLIDANEFD